MADDIQFEIQGLEELLGKFESIKGETKRKAGRSALRKAANLIRAAAKSNAEAISDPETGRSISENVNIRWNSKEFKRSGSLSFSVGVRGGAKVKNKGNPDMGAGSPTPHWRFIELGTQKIKATPFMLPALENNIAPATDTFVREFNKGIDRAIKRAVKKGTSA